MDVCKLDTDLFDTFLHISKVAMHSTPANVIPQNEIVDKYLIWNQKIFLSSESENESQ